MHHDSEKRHPDDDEDSTAPAAGRCHPLLDVSGFRLRASARGDAPRDGLDVDAALLPLWHPGSGTARLALATDTGAARRASSQLRQRQCHLPELCSLSGSATHRRVHPLCRAEAMGGNLLHQGSGDSGDGAHGRHAAHAPHRRSDAAAGDEHLRHLLPPDRHQPSGHPQQFLMGRMAGYHHLSHSHWRAALHPGAQPTNI